MGKNSHLHILLETNFLMLLKKEAEDRAISLSELCRLKLRKSLQLERIEKKLDAVLENKERITPISTIFKNSKQQREILN